MKEFFLVFLGGGLGSVLRFIFSRELNSFSGFPLGTFSVNIAGSFLIGLFIGTGFKNGIFGTNYSLLLITGFCGGFTTFSSFALENQELLKAGEFLNFGIYTLGSILLGIVAVFLGILVSKMF